MTKPISELKEQLARYFKNNSYHRKSDVISSMQKESKYKDEYGLSDSDIAKLVNETLLPGETKKGDVVIHRSKRGDTFTKFGTTLPYYFVESYDNRHGDIWGESYRVLRRDEQYGGKGEVILKNVPASYAERWVMHKIDNTQPSPGRLTSNESMSFHRTSKPVIESDINKIIREYGNARHGIELKNMESHPNLLYRAQDENVTADGYMMMIGKKVTDDIIGSYLDSKHRQDVAKLIKLGSNKEEAEKAITSGEKAYKETVIKFPDWKKLIPEERPQTWKTVGVGKLNSGRYTGEFGGNIVWFASDQGKFSAMDVDKIALIYKHFPGIDKITSAEHSIAYGMEKVNPDFQGSPLVFEQDGKVVAVVMPIFAKNTPEVIRKAASVPTWTAIPTSKSGDSKFDIYKDGVKQDVGAAKKSDIESVIAMLKERENETISVKETMDSDFNQFAHDLKNKVEKSRVKGDAEPTTLQSIESSRSPLSQSSDERQEHSTIIDPDDPRIETWKSDPGRMDVRGIDTPKGKHKTKRKSKKESTPTSVRAMRST